MNEDNNGTGASSTEIRLLLQPSYRMLARTRGIYQGSKITRVTIRESSGLL